MKKELIFGILLIGCESKRDEASKVDVERDEPAMPAQTTREPARTPTPTAPPDETMPPVTGTTPTPSTAPGGTAPPAAKGMGDAEIAMIAATAHDAEIEGGELAVKKSKNKDVQAFGQMMITDHGAAKAKGEMTLGKAGVTPTASDASRQLEEKSTEAAKRLEGLQGAEFDRAYIDEQVRAHQDVLDTLDSKLIPGASNPELKALLVEVRPTIAKHLEQAKSLQAKLQKGAEQAPATPK
jgi:putative membrane protein